MRSSRCQLELNRVAVKSAEGVVLGELESELAGRSGHCGVRLERLASISKSPLSEGEVCTRGIELRGLELKVFAQVEVFAQLQLAAIRIENLRGGWTGGSGWWI